MPNWKQLTITAVIALLLLDLQEGNSRRSSARSCREPTSSPHTALLQATDTRGSYLAVPGQVGVWIINKCATISLFHANL
jgi:hypothetical protein